jgi:hypothetical protein
MDSTSPLWLPNRTAKLPPDIAYLREKYPRETWDEHRNFGETAQRSSGCRCTICSASWAAC